MLVSLECLCCDFDSNGVSAGRENQSMIINHPRLDSPSREEEMEEELSREVIKNGNGQSKRERENEEKLE